MSAIKCRITSSLLLCGVLAASVGAGFAQQSDGASTSTQSGPPRGGPPTAAGELARLTRVLTLTEEQKTAILPILEARHTKIDALMHSSSDRAAVGQEMHTIIDATNAEIRALLTEAQQKIFDNMRPQRPPVNGANRGGSEAGPSSDAGSPPQQ